MPTDLARMASVTRTVADESGINITPIFVTIDPERDTPERLAEYVKQFHPRFVGLTGTDQAIADIADKYAVYYSPVSDGRFLHDGPLDVYFPGRSRRQLSRAFGQETCRWSR